MANIMSQIKLKNHTSRDAFDLSHRNAFTAKVGELLPVSCTEVIPGDSYDISVQHFTRTMPVNTAAYTRIREYYDWFFVPTDLLWNKFGSFVTQMTDNNQHASGINTRVVLTDTHPYFTTSQVHNYLQRLVNTANGGQNLFGYRRSDLSVKLLNYLDYGNFNPSAVPNNNSGYRENVAYNPFPLLAYQKIYQDYYRNSQWEKAYAPAFNIDYMTGQSGTSSLQIPVSDLNITNGSENMFDLRYANWHKDLFMGLLPNAQYGAASIVDTGTGSSSFNISLGETSSYTKNFRVGQGDDALITAGTKVVAGTNWEGTTYSRFQLEGSSERLFDVYTQTDVERLRTALGLTTTGGTANINTSFSILALRQAEALQKWKEVTQSQQQDYKSQVEAHFGVSPDNGYSDMCRWIDGSVSTLDISEVTNTNITGDNAADIAGKGVGVGNSRTSFKSNVHGYLMCIYHAVPMLDYAISGVDRKNLKTKATDYAIPEFDRTGMVSVPIVELTNSTSTFSFTGRLLGYAPRYYDYKQKIDRVHGAFIGDLSHWVAPVNDGYILQYLNGQTSSSINYAFFKINPATLNPIFAMAVGSSVSSDQLLVNAAFDMKAVRNLDRNGLPY